MGRSAPRVVALPPGPPPPGYYADDDEPGFFDEEDDLPPRVLRRGYPDSDPSLPSGPAVITREGIQSQALPPPGSGARLAERERETTGSIPRRSGAVDPLLGVPKEFRGQPQRNAAPQQRTAARSPADSIPQSAPLPLPRPDDAPTVAQNESTSEPAAAPAKAPSLSPEAKKDVEKFPPVQPLE
jgi:hypothetical protein